MDSAKTNSRAKRRNQVGRFTERTESWFERGEELASQAEAGETPEELDGDYLEEPWWGVRLARTKMLFAGGLASLVAAVWLLS